MTTTRGTEMTDPIYTNGQRVTIEIEGVRRPGQITATDGEDWYFAKLADGTLTGKISVTRLAPVMTIRDGDRLMIADARNRNHSVSSLSGYGRKYDSYSQVGGMARYMEDLARNDGKAVWITAEAIVISAHREPLVSRHHVRTGDLVWFDSVAPGEGGWYVVTKPGRYSNDHCSLVRPQP
jgi:hypothetical protein